ncbi:unnamed protein product [Acanthoscelides obtectus]|uniref:Uncharacterized protein n=1 Tax=Acanthoscelides obtectus TaxID=200917 RepID=A0A9P0PPJ8_ACAOB|nr:unnamed protein product [Acanthoscelides obtectus]CAK1684209.1 hypothetical protein AOBTE_LOCUS34707 [Acanthoscelides obtectus]
MNSVDFGYPIPRTSNIEAFLALLSKVWGKPATSENAIAGFEATQKRCQIMRLFKNLPVTRRIPLLHKCSPTLNLLWTMKRNLHQ